MRNDKDTAIALRLKGKSYKEISEILKISKSTLSGWLKNVTLTEEGKRRIERLYRAGSYKGLLNKAKAQTESAIQKSLIIKNNAAQDITSISKQQLFYLGLGLYLGEGYKKPIVKNGITRNYHPVSLSNSDPTIIKLFIRFLQEICNVNPTNIKLAIHLYSPDTEKHIKQFWLDSTGLSKTNFYKSYFGVSQASKRTKPLNHLPYGTLKITVHNTSLYHKIMGWIEGISKQT